MKKTSENTQRSSVNSYRPKSNDIDGENWFANHKKLLWGIGGAVVLGAGAMLLLKNKNDKEAYNDVYDEYNDVYDELNALNENAMNDLGDEEIVITTITELE